MLEKLFARLRSWRHGDLAPSAAGSMLPPSPRGAAGLSTLAGPLTPPPLPADAWAESESGIVITDSGIIILGPESEPRNRPESSSSSSSSSLPAATAPERKLTPGELDWDDVLARARARAEKASESSPPKPGPVRAKAK